MYIQRLTGPALVISLAFASVLPQAALAAQRVFPGPAPCDTTLQACIDGAAPGDVIALVTDGPIAESLQIGKSLTLRASTGFAPRLAPFNSVFVFTEGATDQAVTIDGLILETGVIGAGHGGTGQLSLRLVNNLIRRTFTTSNPGIRLFSGGQGDAVGFIRFEILDNQITVPTPFSGQGTGIEVALGTAPEAQGVIAGNRIVMDQHAGNQQGAIEIVGFSGVLQVDVIGNVISGQGYNHGINLYQQGDGGTLAARVMNNTVSGQTDVAGQPGAIAASCSSGILDATLVNNTLARNESGISFGGRADLGAVCRGLVANNLIAFNSDMGLGIDSDFAVTVPNRNNLLFRNARNAFTAGPGTLTVNPQFLRPGDFRLTPTSPAIDKGDGRLIPPDVATDVAGGSRRFGRTVDIGASEFSAVCQGVPATVVGTPGDDTLVGTPGNDVISGLDGHDTIDGGGGNDLICGDAGNDRLSGSGGDDLLSGGPGTDRLNGDAGRDALAGGVGDDVLNSGAGHDTLDGGPGQDACGAGEVQLRCEP